MNLKQTARRSADGFALALVLVFAVVGFVALIAALTWCDTNATLTERSNQYAATVSAAEAGTEKVIASLWSDFQRNGERIVNDNLASYRLMIPTTGEATALARFSFDDAPGNTNPHAQYSAAADTVGNSARCSVERVGTTSYVLLESQYVGLYGLASTYRLVANAQMSGTRFPIRVGVRQEIQLASIPLFQFADFYNMDMEINPGVNMTITGRVHGNKNIYMQPVNNLTFQSHITASGQLIQNKSTLDPVARDTSGSHIIYQGEHDADVSSLNLPIGTNNSPAAVRAILELPPTGESSSSEIGQQRYYNKSDLIVLVSDAGVTVKSGIYNDSSVIVPQDQWSTFLDTGASFYNKREGKTIQATDLDVGRLRSWSATNTILSPSLGNRDLRSIYVADLRSVTASQESGVRVKDAQTLPSLGLTVATPNPLYVQGNYNAPNGALGTTDTSGTLPSSLLADAIHIMSAGWNDANSGASISHRVAQNTTVNAAFLGGIVPSDGTHYSGGLENFPRFMEDWSGKTFTYNGSMVVMFNSAVAIGPWGSSDVYNPPARSWAFDTNFLDPTRLPPGTPDVRALVRGHWAISSSPMAGSTE